MMLFILRVLSSAARSDYDTLLPLRRWNKPVTATGDVPVSMGMDLDVPVRMDWGHYSMDGGVLGASQYGWGLEMSQYEWGWTGDIHVGTCIYYVLTLYKEQYTT